jgi:hypothetical protein
VKIQIFQISSDIEDKFFNLFEINGTLKIRCEILQKEVLEKENQISDISYQKTKFKNQIQILQTQLEEKIAEKAKVFSD